MAHAFIDAIADAGADAVKFQTHIAAAESTPAEEFRVPLSSQDNTRYDYWRRMEFTPPQWRGLRHHAEDRKLVFLSSPFSCEAVHLLLSCGIQAWKVPSGELQHGALLDAIGLTQLPVILSTGMASWQDIQTAVTRLRSHRLPFAILQCTSRYPTPAEEVGMQLMSRYQREFNCPVGLSDHSGTIYPGFVAAASGASVIEIHVTFSRRMFGPDVTSSITIEELHELVRGVRFIERMLSVDPDKDATARELEPVRRIFSRSIVARRSLVAGTVLCDSDVMLKKPGSGLPPDRLSDVLGKRTLRNIDADSLLRMEDLAPPL